MWSKLSRRHHLLLAGGVLALVLVLVAAWSLIGDTATARSTQVEPVSVAYAAPNEPQSVTVSRALFASSPSAVLVRDDAAPDVVTRGIEAAGTHHVPLLTVGPSSVEPVRRELERLGARTVAAVEPSSIPDVGVTVGDLQTVADQPAPVVDPTLVLVAERTDPDEVPTPAVEAAARVAAQEAAGTATAAGATGIVVSRPDPRASGQAIDFIKRHPSARVVGIGGEFGTTALLAANLDAARQAPELPGGGYTLFPGRRMVALYGSPGAPSLGPLGRQSLPATVARAQRLAASYQPFSKEKVIPAFEIIVTVASASPGPGNSYTNVIDPKEILPWVIEAGKSGIYVTLDLQPGRVDFLTQAKLFTALLKYPHVGLALDPEWRLKPNQVHLTQIGSVAAAEVNRVSDWLAALVRDNHLPQKLFVLHQFDSDMLANRDRISTAHPELQFMVHADGHGTPPVKMSTWNRLITGLSPDYAMGWKNFYTEDHPPFSPQQTMAVKPTPWFVSYQ